MSTSQFCILLPLLFLIQFFTTTLATTFTPNRSIELTLQSTISTQNPTVAFPNYISSINFRLPKSTTPSQSNHYYFSFFIADGDSESGIQPVIPPNFYVELQLFQIAPQYHLIFREAKYNHHTVPTEFGINMISDAYPLDDQLDESITYRLNVHVRWLNPLGPDIPPSAEIDAFLIIHQYQYDGFRIQSQQSHSAHPDPIKLPSSFKDSFNFDKFLKTHRNKHQHNQLQMTNRPLEKQDSEDLFYLFSLDDFTYSSISYQLNTYEIFNAQYFPYPFPDSQTTPTPETLPSITKANSPSISIQYNPREDHLSMFDLWAVWTDFTPTDPRLIPSQYAQLRHNKQIFNGRATTLSFTMLGGVHHFVKVVDNDIDYIIKGCTLNQVRIDQEFITFVNQTINFNLDNTLLTAVASFNNDIIHVRCFDTYYIMSPARIASTPPSPLQTPNYLNLDTFQSFLQISRQSHQFPLGSPGANLDISDRIQLLNSYTQIFPITHQQINAGIDLVSGFQYPMMTPYLSDSHSPPNRAAVDVEASDQLSPVEAHQQQRKDEVHQQREEEQQRGLHNHNNADLSAFLPTTTITSTPRPADASPRTHADEDTHQYAPLYGPYLDSATTSSPIYPGVSTTGALQWFSPHQQTSSSTQFQTLAVGATFQYTFPLRTNHVTQHLIDSTGFAAFQPHFLSEPKSKLHPPRFRLFVPYIHTFWRADLDQVFRDCVVTVTCIQTGVRYVGAVPWHDSIMGYSKWVTLDYESLLFPQYLVQSGDIDEKFYINNPPVIQIGYSVFGGEKLDLHDIKDENGETDFSGIPQQTALELQHTYLKDGLNEDDIKLQMIDHKVKKAGSDFESARNSSSSTPTPGVTLDLTQHVQSDGIDSLDQKQQQQQQHPYLHYTKRSSMFAPQPTTLPSISLLNSTQFQFRTQHDEDDDREDPDSPYKHKTFYSAAPIPYATIQRYTQTGVELIALSSTYPAFRIINHQSEPIGGLVFYIHGPFSFFTDDSAPHDHATALNNITIYCGDDVCIPTELKIKENFILITLPRVVTSGFRVYFSDDEKLGWYPRFTLPGGYAPSLLFPFVSLQILHCIGTDPVSGGLILQDFRSIHNQTVSMDWQYADKYIARSSRGNRPFSWTLDQHTAFIVAWVGVSICFALFALFVGFAVYYYFGSRAILNDGNGNGNDEQDDSQPLYKGHTPTSNAVKTPSNNNKRLLHPDSQQQLCELSSTTITTAPNYSNSSNLSNGVSHIAPS